MKLLRAKITSPGETYLAAVGLLFNWCGEHEEQHYNVGRYGKRRGQETSNCFVTITMAVY